MCTGRRRGRGHSRSGGAGEPGEGKAGTAGLFARCRARSAPQRTASTLEPGPPGQRRRSPSPRAAPAGSNGCRTSEPRRPARRPLSSRVGRGSWRRQSRRPEARDEIPRAHHRAEVLDDARKARRRRGPEVSATAVKWSTPSARGRGALGARGPRLRTPPRPLAPLVEVARCSPSRPRRTSRFRHSGQGVVAGPVGELRPLLSARSSTERRSSKNPIVRTSDTSRLSAPSRAARRRRVLGSRTAPPPPRRPPRRAAASTPVLGTVDGTQLRGQPVGGGPDDALELRLRREVALGEVPRTPRRPTLALPRRARGAPGPPRPRAPRGLQPHPLAPPCRPPPPAADRAPDACGRTSSPRRARPVLPRVGGTAWAAGGDRHAAPPTRKETGTLQYFLSAVRART